MHFENLYAVLDTLNEQCDAVTSRFRVNKSQIEKLKSGVAAIQTNPGAFIPQFMICGEAGVGKTTLLKFMVNELSQDVLTLPSGGGAHTNVPTVVTFTPQASYAANSASHTFTINYMSRQEYFDGLLWVIENLVGNKKDKVMNAVRAARASGSFDDLKKACDAAHDACGSDTPELRKSLRKASDDCRDGDRMESQFRALAALHYRKDCHSLAALDVAGANHMSELVKSVSIDVAVQSDKIPCAFRVVDLPAPNVDAIHHLYYGYKLSRGNADATVAVLPANKLELSKIGERYFDALLGAEGNGAKAPMVFYALNKSISPDDDALDPQHAEKLLENLISTRNWTAPSSAHGAGRIFMTDGLAGLLHELRAQPDLNAQAKMHFGVENDQVFKNIKRKWNSGRVGNDNAGLKGALHRLLTYEWPKSNFAALKSAASELSATFCSIIDNIKPDQSKRFEHKFNSINDDALQQFEDCTASIENQVDQLHRSLRQNIIETLSQAMDASKRGSDRHLKVAKSEPSSKDISGQKQTPAPERSPAMNGQTETRKQVNA